MTIRVLIVEDDRPTRSLLRYVVEAIDSELYCAASADEALVRAPWADIAVVDSALPGESSIELLEELRAMNPDVTLVLVSGDDAAERAARDAGAEVCLTDPFALDDLHNAIVHCRPSGAARDELATVRLDMSDAGAAVIDVR